MNDSKDAATLVEHVRKNTKPEIKDIERGALDKASVILVPDGMSAKSIKPFLDEYRQKPERRRGTITADRLESFIAITNRFKNEDSVIFARAKIEQNKIDAHIRTVFDYHPDNGNVEEAEYAEHGAYYSFPTSKDFDFWMENNHQPMSQIDFALFLEERHIEMRMAKDVEKTAINGLKPKFADPLDMLELSKDLEVYSNETFRSKNKLSSGETELKFSAEHVDSGGKPIQIPDFFIVEVPVFEGGLPQRIMVRLRYRIKDGSVRWFYDLYRIDLLLNTAFEESCADVQAKTDLPLFFGKKE